MSDIANLQEAVEAGLAAHVRTSECVAKTWSLKQAGLFVVTVVTMSTVLWGVIIFVVWQMAY